MLISEHFLEGLHFSMSLDLAGARSAPPPSSAAGFAYPPRPAINMCPASVARAQCCAGCGWVRNSNKSQRAEESREGATTRWGELTQRLAPEGGGVVPPQEGSRTEGRAGQIGLTRRGGKDREGNPPFLVGCCWTVKKKKDDWGRARGGRRKRVVKNGVGNPTDPFWMIHVATTPNECRFTCQMHDCSYCGNTLSAKQQSLLCLWP
jgi:hypothetical protein